MVHSTPTTRFRFWLWLIRAIGVIVPLRWRADWWQEWEAELHYREALLTRVGASRPRPNAYLLRHGLTPNKVFPC
jgi:hypothetical protein